MSRNRRIVITSYSIHYTKLYELLLAPAAAQAQWGGGFDTQDRELLEQFDTDGDGVLDARERDAARAVVGTTSSSRRGGPRPGMPFGGGSRSSGYPGVALDQDA